MGDWRSAIRDCQMEDGTRKMREEGSRLEIEMRDAKFAMRVRDARQAVRGSRWEMGDQGFETGDQIVCVFVIRVDVRVTDQGSEVRSAGLASGHK